MNTVRTWGVFLTAITTAAAGCATWEEVPPEVGAQVEAVTTATWAPETALATPAMGVLRMRVATNDAGDAAVVWDERLSVSLNRVWAAVFTGGRWSAPYALSDGVTNGASGGVTVSPSGAVTVFWMTNGAPWSADCTGGAWGAAQRVPTDALYTNIVGAAVDRNGNIEVVAGYPRTAATYPAYDLESLVRAPTGAWSAPVRFSTASGVAPKFVMNRNGQAVVKTGMVLYRSSALGVWSAPQTIALAGQIYSTDVAIDAGGRGYFVARSRYGGANLSTSTPTSAWTAPRRVTKFDVLGSTLMVAASSADHAVIFGQDYSTGMARASVTANGGGAWGGLVNLGAGTPIGVGSESGLYAIGWNEDPLFRVATGTGSGTGTAAWVKTTLTTNYPYGALGLAGNRAVSAWTRGGDASLTTYVVGASAATLAP